MKTPIVELMRVRLDQADIGLPLERTERRVHLSRTVAGDVHAIVGIATSDVDVVVTDDFGTPRHPEDVPVLCVSRKAGKYDGRERDRLLFRRFPAHQTRELSIGTVDVLRTDDGRACVAVADEDGSTLWSGAYRRWTHELTDPDRAGDIVLWHWRRYYSFLDECEVRSIAGGFGDTAVGMTLAAANRQASRVLYALARESGWRKLTLREQRAWGLEGQWHREAEIASARGLAASGCGDRTLMAASMSAQIEAWVGGRE